MQLCHPVSEKMLFYRNGQQIYVTQFAKDEGVIKVDEDKLVIHGWVGQQGVLCVAEVRVRAGRDTTKMNTR